VPASWEWKDFLAAAPSYVPYAFEKSDAQERWGGENVFSAAMGGRSLRFTGTKVHGRGVSEGEEAKDSLEQEIRAALRKKRADTKTHTQPHAQAAAGTSADKAEEEVDAQTGVPVALLLEVGGAESWRKLLDALREKIGFEGDDGDDGYFDEEEEEED